jgi:flagellin-like hook-associated protein FlgL
MIYAGTNLSNNPQSNFAKVQRDIDSSIANLSSLKKANLGSNIDNLTNVIANTTVTQNRIENYNYAIETTSSTITTIIQQSATSMLAQGNANKNFILNLINS